MAERDGQFAEFERAGWAARGPEYAAGFGAFTAHCVPALLDAVEPCSGRLLIDVGTGPGIAALAATLRGAQVIGADESAVMLGSAHRRLRWLVRARAQQLPLRTDGADILVGNLVVNHLPDPPAGMAEFLRVLSPGGRLALTAWDLAGDNHATALIGRAMQAAGVQPPPTPASPWAAYAEPAAFAALLRGSGLADVRVDPVAFTHVVPPDVWWQAICSGTVCSAAQLSGLDDRSRSAVRVAYDDLIGPYVDSEGRAHLPGLAWLAAGRVGQLPGA